MLDKIKRFIYKAINSKNNNKEEEHTARIIKDTMYNRYGEKNIEHIDIEIKEHGKINVQVKLKDTYDHKKHVMFAQ